ncbi:MAG: Cys-tRNA(Pro) deacylase [Polyangiaceae bacterium]|nr:Cys-tRNA(Pro) deacylase [Polyangiaceae bacterium]
MAEGFPETPATKFLRGHKITFQGHLYDYEAHGGTRVSSEKLGVSEHQVIKTLVMEDENKKPLIVLQHGDKKVSTKELARQIGRKKVEPCDPDVAERHSGYQVGGTSPFGTRKAMPVYVESSVLALEAIWINGGKRGFLVSLDPRALVIVLNAKEVSVAL